MGFPAEDTRESPIELGKVSIPSRGLWVFPLERLGKAKIC